MWAWLGACVGAWVSVSNFQAKGHRAPPATLCGLGVQNDQQGPCTAHTCHVSASAFQGLTPADVAQPHASQ